MYAWVRSQVLPCSHGVCTRCFETLVAREARLTTCPLCRERILKPSPQEVAAAVAAAQAAAVAEQVAAAPPTGGQHGFVAAQRVALTGSHACNGGGGSSSQRQLPDRFGGLRLEDYGIVAPRHNAT